MIRLRFHQRQAQGVELPVGDHALDPSERSAYSCIVGSSRSEEHHDVPQGDRADPALRFGPGSGIAVRECPDEGSLSLRALL